MKIRLAGEMTTDSIVDGEGIRSVIWCQGCIHNCPGCHNPETHSFDGGFLKEVSTVLDEISELEFQDGITLSGGDPMCQIDACLEIAKHCKKIGLNVWCYTGYTYERLIEMSKTNLDYLCEILKEMDIKCKILEQDNKRGLIEVAFKLISFIIAIILSLLLYRASFKPYNR